MRHRARKRFGQHFLHDPGVIQRIVDAIAPKPGQRLVEIGPGRGAITLPLLRRAGEMEAIELDRDLIPMLEADCEQVGVLRIHSGDFLDMDLGSFWQGGAKLRIVGNLPYNISTPLIFKLLDAKSYIEDMHFMLQKEVAERMTAEPGTKTYGRLTVMLAAHCSVRRLFRVGAGAFKPPPRVESVFVRIEPLTETVFSIEDAAMFAKLVSHAFSQRRKTLRNAIRLFLDERDIREVGLDPSLRPEALSPTDFARLANRVSAKKQG
jgi:16S rRNA (adenine1518-N6/adenine1519-N6)-dimethyltransferase